MLVKMMFIVYGQAWSAKLNVHDEEQTLHF